MLRIPALRIVLCMAVLPACSSPPVVREPPIDPDAARSEIYRRLPAAAANRAGWAIDIFAAFEALSIRPTTQHICAVIAVTGQESTFEVDPQVAGLATIARREIDTRAARFKIPKLVVSAALELPSPTGASYRERLDKVRTEKELSVLFADFIGMVPLGERLFGSLNPVRTGGPMQVSIAFAQEQAEQKRYPYPLPGSIRDEVFTRRGGMYFGIAHLLDYPAAYDSMLFRFADFNAGRYASRNAAFQSAINALAKTSLALDGDLLLHGRRAEEASNTELAVRSIADRLDLDDAQIRRDLELGQQQEFDDSRLYKRVFAIADKAGKRSLPRAIVPAIRLHSPKITRKLTTQWFAKRVNERYDGCLARVPDRPRT